MIEDLFIHRVKLGVVLKEQSRPEYTILQGIGDLIF